MIIIFGLGEGFFCFLIVLMLLAVFGVAGTASALISFIMRYWYIILIAIILKSIFDALLYLYIYRQTETRNRSEILLLHSTRNKLIVLNSISNGLAFISFLIFATTMTSIIEQHPFLSLVYSIPYFGAIFGTFLSTLITALSAFETLLDGSKYSVESLIKTQGGDSLCKMKAYLIIANIVLIVSLYTNNILFLIISAIATYFLCCMSSIE